MYVEHRFVNMLQALESYHRRIRPPTADKIAEHGRYVAKVLESVPSEQKKWLKDKIKRLPEIRVAERLKEFVVLLDAAWIFSDHQH